MGFDHMDGVGETAPVTNQYLILPNQAGPLWPGSGESANVSVVDSAETRDMSRLSENPYLSRKFGGNNHARRTDP
jgi:hypothetical protein